MRKYLLTTLLIGFWSLGFSQNPIYLISLHDKDTIDYKYPAFNWFYTSVLNDRGNNEQYRFVLVELKPEQSAESGVTVNQPLMQINGLTGFQMVYPYDAPELQFGKRYGWRIQRIQNNIVTGQSEAWEFILFRKIEIPMKYAILNTAFSSSTYNVEGKGFYFKLKSNYKSDTPLKYTVLDKESKNVNASLGEDQKLGKDEEPEKTARYFHYLKTDGLAPGIYTLLVTDGKGNKYNTRFQVL